MRHPIAFPVALTLVLVLAGAQAVSTQALPTPAFRPTDGRDRGTRLLENVQTIDRDLAAVRRVFIDTMSGTLDWLEFEPGAIAQTQTGDTPESAARTLVGTYGTQLFATDLGTTDLELVKVREDLALTHLRYAQRYRGRRVYGGDLLIHVLKVGGRYAVQSVNGRIYPGIAIPSDPAISFDAAQGAALGITPGARAGEAQDSSLIVVPHDNGYRLAYVVYVHDPAAGAVIRYVDALTGTPFADTRAVWTWREDSPSGASTSRAPSPRIPPPTGPATMEQVSTFGFDALEQRRDFNVWRNSATQFSMQSTNWPGVTAIEVRDFQGAFLVDPCRSTDPYVQATSIDNGWPSGPNDLDGSEEVSAVANMGETLRFYNTKFGRLGVRDEYVFGRPVLHPVRGCVHPVTDEWNAYYHPGNGSWVFGPRVDTFKSPAAAQDVVTHEMQHGVTDVEIDPVQQFNTSAVNEALSDYFGTRHRGSSCLAFDARGSCLREINSDLTLSQRQDDPNCGPSFHCVGVAFSSGLWRTAHLLSWFGDDTDWAAYNGLQFYMASTVQFVTGREAVVRAAKDRLHNASSTADDIVYDLENEFFRRGIGPEAITVDLRHPLSCGEWTADVGGSGSRSFRLYFEAGTEYWPDESVGHRFYQASLGTFTSATLPGSFTASQLGGHTGNDGHAHTFLFNFVDLNPMVGWLNYYAGDFGGCGISPQVASDSASAAIPKKFAVRQAIGTDHGFVSSRVAAATGARRARGITDAPDVNRSLSDQVRTYGVTALEVDVPASMAGKRLEVRIFNLQGQPVRTLVEDAVPAGRKTVAWDRLTDRGTTAPVGVYTVVVRYGSQGTRTRFVVTPTR